MFRSWSTRVTFLSRCLIPRGRSAANSESCSSFYTSLLKPHISLTTPFPLKCNSYCNASFKRLQKTSFRNFHTSSPRRIHPLLVLAVKSVGKAVAIFSGRGFRKWWKALPANKKEFFWSELKNNRKRIALISGLCALLMGIYYQTHIQETPITRRKRFVALTSEQFQKIADFEYQLQKTLFEDGLLPTTDPSYQRVGAITHRLLSANANLRSVPNRVWSISIIDLPVQNAFVLPGGQIFVFKGMLDLCTKDDQLGVILAHEIAHCILEHGVEQLSYGHLLDFVIIALLAAIWAFVPSDGIAIVTQWFFHKVVAILLSLPYSRKLETEADEVGLELAAKACFDVRESSAFWARMAVMESGDANVEWLSTHPRHEDRSANLNEIMLKALELRSKCGCPKLPEVDPRDEVEVLKNALGAEIEHRRSQPKALLITVPKAA